jgi:hypothetical protein
MKTNNKSREDSFQELVKLTKTRFKPRPGFRSMGDVLSDNDATIISFGVQAAVNPPKESKDNAPR